MNLTLEQMETILRNRKTYMRIIQCHLLEERKKTNELGIQNNFIGNNSEISFINKIDDSEYKRACCYLKAINELYESLSERRKLVYRLRYVDRYPIYMIQNHINYSIDTIHKDLNFIKKNLLSILKSDSNSNNIH